MLCHLPGVVQLTERRGGMQRQQQQRSGSCGPHTYPGLTLLELDSSVVVLQEEVYMLVPEVVEGLDDYAGDGHAPMTPPPGRS